jgi:hypothetical protein
MTHIADDVGTVWYRKANTVVLGEGTQRHSVVCKVLMVLFFIFIYVFKIKLMK